MNKFLKLSLALIAFLINTRNVAYSQSTVTAQAIAEIIQALTATEGSTLNFGRFSPENEGGEIRLSPDGVRMASGKLLLGAGSYNPASFYLTGQPEFSVNITLPSGPVLLTNSEKGKTMEVKNWESNPPVGPGVKIQSSGILNLSVGATLKVGSINDNPVGKYVGTYNVTFGYN